MLGVLLFLLPSVLSGVLQVALSVGLYATALIDLYCQSNFATSLSPRILALVLQTDAHEIADFLSAYGFTLLRWSRFHFLLFVILFHIVGVCFMGRLVRAVASFRVNVRLWRVLLVLWGLLLIACLPSAVAVKKHYIELLSQPTMTDMEGVVFRGYGQAANTPWWRLLYAVQGNRLACHDVERQKQTARHIVVDSCSYRSPLVVLVIGESYNRHHSQLYGYQLPTTPYQIERRDSNQLFVFTDVVTPWNITSNAFTQMFSLYGYGSAGQWGDYPLFPQLFRRAGYQVSFFSNQFVHRWSSMGNQSGGFFIDDPEVCDSLFDVRNRSKRVLDGNFLHAIRDELSATADTALVIIHLHGQHFEYARRSPQSARYFTLSDYNNRPLTDEQRGIVADYDNATRYNDYVMDQIIRHYANRPTVLIYLSDHGEECYDDLPVHGRLYQELDRRQVRQEFEIPFWIWCSETYQAMHPDVVECIRAAVDRPFMTDHLPHMLLWLAGISCPYYEEDHNLLSPQFDTSRIRLLEGTVDYDALMRGKAN